MRQHKFTVAAFMGGLGAGLLGMLRARQRFADETGEHEASFKSVGSIDIDGAACADFQMLTGSPALHADMHKLTPAELLAFMPECPDAVLTSPPCKGFSRLISTSKAKEAKYTLLNELVYRGIFLAVETWAQTAKKRPGLIVLENVPGITSRGKNVLDRAKKILHAYGYHLHEGQHDCGEIGGLAQHRKRYLLVARLPSSVSAFMHKPPIQRVRACGEVLETLPVPRGADAADAGPMHVLPNIKWDTWVKLSRIPAGGDWRDLPAELQPNVDPESYRGSPGLMGVLDPADPSHAITGTMAVSSSNTPAAVADRRVGHGNRSPLGVRSFEEPFGVVAGRSDPTNGSYSVADPRAARLVTPLKPGQKRREVHPRFGVADWEKSVGTVAGSGSNGVYAVADPRSFKGRFGVKGFDEPMGTVTGESMPTNGSLSVADPRVEHFDHSMRVTDWGGPVGTITAGGSPSNGAPSVADPRPERFRNSMGVTRWDEPMLTVTSKASPSSGPKSVAEPRVATLRGGQYGVVSWQEASASIIGSCSVDNGRYSVADPRSKRAPPPIIIAEDGTWHRPISTLEMAALQAIPTTLKGKPLVLAGTSSSAWRERIGNAIPVDAGKAIGSSCLKALLASKLGTWFLSTEGIWVRQRDYFVMPELREAVLQ